LPARARPIAFAPPLVARDRAALAALVAAAALVRWLVWERTAALFNDGPRFLAIAEAIGAGEWSAALHDPFHPLYPAAAAGLARALPGLGLEDAAALVSVAGGSAAVAFAFLFLREAFGAPAAWVGAALLAAHGRAIEYASDVQSDGLYLGLFAAGLWLGWRAWRSGSIRLAAGAGAAAGLAYLVRPEGIGLVGILALLGLVEVARGAWPRGAGVAWLAALGVTALLVAVPYLVALRAESGVWALTHKKSLAALVGAAPATEPAAALVPPAWAGRLGLEPPAGIDPAWMDPGLDDDGRRLARAPTPAMRAFEAARMLARTSRSALRYGVFVLVVVGFVHAWRRRRAGEAVPPHGRAAFVGLVLATYAVALFALTYAAGYVSRRHALPPLLPMFGYAGLGALAAGAWLARRSGRSGRRAATAAAALVAGLVVGGELVGQLEPKRAEELASRRAAEWLRANATAPGRLAAPRQRIGYYAGMPYVPLAGVATDAIGPYLTRAGARYVVLDDAGQVAALRRWGAPGLRALHREVAWGREAWVFEIAPPGADPGRVE
jgi:hypothetical protein